MGRIWTFLIIMLWAAVPAALGQYLPVDPGTVAPSRSDGSIVTNDGEFDLRRRAGNDLGLLTPDAAGNYVLIPGGPRPEPDPDLLEAQELKLKVRELAAQLLETWPNDSLGSLVALPTSFVLQDNLSQSNSLGRYIAETLFYEFNTRGFPTREYRAESSILLQPGTGELAFSQSSATRGLSGDWAAILLGTMYCDSAAVFVNARLVRASDGLVLRTGQVILPMNDLVKRMITPPPPMTSRYLPPHPFGGGVGIQSPASGHDPAAAAQSRSSGGGMRIVQGPR